MKIKFSNIITPTGIARVLGAIWLLFANLHIGYSHLGFSPFNQKDFKILFPLITCFTLAISIYAALVNKNHFWLILFAFLIIIYNPIKPIFFSIYTQQGINGIVACLIFLSIFFVAENTPKNL